MSDIGDTLKAHKQSRLEKKKSNQIRGVEILNQHDIPFKCLNGITHLRVNDEYDYWPSTGKFIHRKTKKHGRGIFNLIKRIEK